MRKDPEYYAKIYGLLDDPAFIGSVRRLLELRDIQQFRPGEHAPMNEAKGAALDAVMTELDRAVHDFMANCKTDLATNTQIRKFAEDCNAFFGNYNHLTHAIREAGMISTSTRIKVKGRLHSVVIVRQGSWTAEAVEKASKTAGGRLKLIEAVGLDNPFAAAGV